MERLYKYSTKERLEKFFQSYDSKTTAKAWHEMFYDIYATYMANNEGYLVKLILEEVDDEWIDRHEYYIFDRTVEYSNWFRANEPGSIWQEEENARETFLIDWLEM